MKNSGLFWKCVAMLILSMGIIAGCARYNPRLSLAVLSDDPKIEFAVKEIISACAEKGITVNLSSAGNARIIMEIEPDLNILKPEGFVISKVRNKIYMKGADAAGAMYGGLELAEQLKLYGINGIRETIQNPYMELRGTKFNIPLDVRTPSYSDAGDPAQHNIPEMWNLDFWTEYIDNLARYRFNFISLWSLHPFPSMVRVPDYPDIALNDVMRSTVEWEENYHLHGTGLDTPEILANPEIVRKMTIDEKMDFWREVMRYAKSRNIDICIVTWNIFVNGTDGKYGITDDIDNPVTRDYFKKSVKQMFVTYPDLAGIGLTTGENMPGSGFLEKEEWAYETYAGGIMEASYEMPDRQFVFIHRLHFAGIKDIRNKFEPLIKQDNIEFLFSFKYAQAHVYSATEQPFHEKYIDDFAGQKTLWTLRNDDIYYFRWGAPDFVREFIKNIPIEVSKGFYYGSDQWIWGREFLMKEADSPRKLEIVKHWYHWMIWGRLGYDPDMDNERFISILQNMFPLADAQQLFTAWQKASMVYPLTTGFHWGQLDFQWYIEGCKSRPGPAQNETGFHDVNRFITLPPHSKSGFQSIPAFVKMKLSGGNSGLRSPYEVAKLLHDHSDEALLLVSKINSGSSNELRHTLNDIKTMALMGKYYAHKIAGATSLAIYRETKENNYRVEAVSQLEMALTYWENYIEAAMSGNINPVWLNRVGYVDWVKLTEEVKKDIEIAGEI